MRLSVRDIRPAVVGVGLAFVLLTTTGASTSQASVQDCTDEVPISCDFDVEPGNYRVTVELGDPEQAGLSSVSAEARRALLPVVETDPGASRKLSFIVNVRDPEGQPTDDDWGTPGLQIRIGGSSPQLASIDVQPASDPTVVYVAGDSTTCDQHYDPYTGWGQMFPKSFTRPVSIANYADSGESSGSFLSNPVLFPAITSLIQADDYVFIQFGHNDKTTTEDDYQANLTAMVADVRESQGTPVLVSPPVRRHFDDNGELTSTALHVNELGVDLPAAMREVAAVEDVPMLDLTAKSADLLRSLGPDGSAELYLPELDDNTHFSEHGADVMAGLVIEGIQEQGLRIADFLR